MTINTIICATKETPKCKFAEDRAIEIAKQNNSKLIFLYVIDGASPGNQGAGSITQNAKAKAIERGILSADVLTEERQGDVVSQIKASVQQHCADLVIIGYPHTDVGFLARHLLEIEGVGNFVKRLGEKIGCKAMIASAYIIISEIKSTDPELEISHKVMIDTIICATKGSSGCKIAENKAIEIAKKYNSKIIFLYVIDVGFLEKGVGGGGEWTMDDAVSGLKNVGGVILDIAKEKAVERGMLSGDVLTEERTGDIASQIKVSVEQNNADLVIIGHPETDVGFLERHLLKRDGTEKFVKHLKEKIGSEVMIV